MNIDRFVRSQNVEHYQRVLETVADEPSGRKSSAPPEEQQKQAQAGDTPDR
jgi:hypothetical protein